MVKLRDWLKNNSEKTKEKTKEKYEEVKSRTKEKYNKVLDTEVEEIQDKTKQFVGGAIETTKGYLTAIFLILYFMFWLLVPAIFIITIFYIFIFSGNLVDSNYTVIWVADYSPFIFAGIFSVIYIGVLSFVFIKTPEGLFKKAQKRGFKFSFLFFLLLLVIAIVTTNFSYLSSLLAR